MDFEWNIFPGFNTLLLSDKVKSLLMKLGETPESLTGRIQFMTMFNDISCGSRDNEKECMSNAHLVSLFAKRFGEGLWSFSGLGSEKSGTLSVKIVHKEYGTIWREGREWIPQKADVQFFSATSLCGRLKSKGHGT